MLSKTPSLRQAWVAHTCNPSYLGARDQEDHGSSTALVNSETPISKRTEQNGLEVWLKW
jgi:hypothetical protein